MKTNGCKPWIFNSLQEEISRMSTLEKEKITNSRDIGLPTLVSCLDIWQGCSNLMTYRSTSNQSTPPSWCTQKQNRQSGKVWSRTCHPMPGMQPKLHREIAKPLGTRMIVHLSCRQPQSAISEHKLNTGHRCSRRGVTSLDLKENWYRRHIKEAINIHKGSRHKTERLARNSGRSCHAPACIT